MKVKSKKQNVQYKGATIKNCYCTNNEIKINDTIYNYSDVGDGPVLIFLHGLLLDKTIFDITISHLFKSFRCISFDLPAHGYSGFKRAGWSLESIATDIATFVQEMGISDVTIIGHSQGSNIALFFAAYYPNLAKNLLLLGGNVTKDENADKLKYWSNLSQLIREKKKPTLTEVLNSYLLGVYSPSQLDKVAREKLVLHKLNRLLHIPNQGLVQAISIAILDRDDLSFLLPKILCKTTIVHGGVDFAIPEFSGKYISKNIINSEYILFPNASHCLPIEQPDYLADLISKVII